MKRTIAVAVVGMIALTGLGRAVAAQQKEEPIDPRILAYDKGPDRINVSKYPADMQAKYKVFAKKCSNCHTLARAINCEFALDDEWEPQEGAVRQEDGGSGQRSEVATCDAIWARHSSRRPSRRHGSPCCRRRRSASRSRFHTPSTRRSAVPCVTAASPRPRARGFRMCRSARNATPLRRPARAASGRPRPRAERSDGCR